MCIQWIIITFVILIQVKAQTEGQVEECVVDLALSWDAEGNYVDCTSEENQQDGTTSCCRQGMEVGCCAGDKWETMKTMGIIVGSCTVTLALLMFVVMWCNPNTFPCIKKLKYRAQAKYTQWEQNSCCCRKAALRRLEEEKQAEVPQYDVPQETQAQVTDQFWGPA